MGRAANRAARRRALLASDALARRAKAGGNTDCPGLSAIASVDPSGEFLTDSARQRTSFVELAQERAVRRQASASEFESDSIAGKRGIRRQDSTTGAGEELAARLQRRLDRESEVTDAQAEPERNFVRRCGMDSELAAKMQRQQERLSVSGVMA